MAVFGDNYGLNQLYVPLNASYYKQTKDRNESLFGALNNTSKPNLDEKNEKPLVIELMDHLTAWLDKMDPNDAVRIISGGPGSGKSSFAKILAAESAATGIRKVLFIPLHEIDIENDIIMSIGKYLRHDFHENPLDNEDRLLIIFDGLDELTEVGRKYSDAAQDFINRVDKQIISQNRGGRCIQVLYTGRVVVTQSVQSLFKREQVLTLIPYYTNKDKRNLYIDDNKILEIDKRNIWWQQYGRLTGHNYESIPEIYKKDRLIEITAQPLINYLIALSYKAGNTEGIQIENLNTVYNLLINSMYKRDWEKTGQFRFIRDMSEDDYLLVLETIAIAAWHGSGRTATVDEITTHCKNSEFPIQWETFKSSAEQGAANLLTTFYFKQVEPRLDGLKPFEFTHKSFREYLTARRMVRLLEYMNYLFELQKHKRYSTYPEKSALESWHKLCAPTAMDNVLYRFLKDEIALQTPEVAEKWQTMLCRLIEYVTTEGMPPTEPRPKFLEEDRLNRNAETALLAAHSACAWKTDKTLPINWGEATSAGAWLTRLRGQRTGLYILLYKCLNHMYFRSCYLLSNDFNYASLIKADLSYSILHSASLKNTFIFNVNLSHAFLYGADLSGAGLHGADLHGANLAHANLTYANLSGADLHGARLTYANLSGANLSGANLSRADLSGTNLKFVRINKKTLTDIRNKFEIIE